MWKQLAKTRWARGPVRLARRISQRIAPARKAQHGGTDNPYYRYLRQQYVEFMKERFPELDEAAFLATIERNIDPKISAAANNYVADLWDLFEPSYKRDFGPFYKWHEKLLFFRFLTYATNLGRIRTSYAGAYELAIDRLGRLDILEVGGGVPHGLIHSVQQRSAGFCERLTYVDLDVLHADFVAWYCGNHGIALRQQRVQAARTPPVPDGTYNFIFAKDVFEHLDHPERLLDDLVAHLAPGGVLAVDLEDKGPVVHQHISPNLPPLKDKLRGRGFSTIASFGVVTVWTRAAS